MASIQTISERRTSADDVFDHLYGEIVSLKIPPGSKMSEVEISKQFEVSRQPVREAFIRLGNLGLLLIRPQKATVVRKFSLNGIANARFIRLSIELEVLRKACKLGTARHFQKMEKNLDQQAQAITKLDAEKFHALDSEFHKLVCIAGGSEFAFSTISENKAQVDRLCMLSLSNSEEMALLHQDHRDILDGIKQGDEIAATAAIRRHLGRLDASVEAAKTAHSEYFED